MTVSRSSFVFCSSAEGQETSLKLNKLLYFSSPYIANHREKYIFKGRNSHKIADSSYIWYLAAWLMSCCQKCYGLHTNKPILANESMFTSVSCPPPILVAGKRNLYRTTICKADPSPPTSSGCRLRKFKMVIPVHSDMWPAVNFFTYSQ